MHFTVIDDPARFIIEIDKPVGTIGIRAESPYPLITLVERGSRAIFNYKPRDIHPDLLALLCLVIYYPFIHAGDQVYFPQPISNQLITKLADLPIYDPEVNKYRQVRNVTWGARELKNGASGPIGPAVREPYSGQTDLISLGGGLDSTAVACLFPRAHLVHEYPMHDFTTTTTTTPRGDRGIDELITLLSKRNNSATNLIIESNNKYLVKPSGWTGWISCIATSLLVATDLNVKNIILGSSLGGLLQSGPNGDGGTFKFIGPSGRFPHNIWSELLHSVGLNLCTPILGLSEIALAKIIDSYGGQRYLNTAIWCDKNEGYCCHKCFKCLRRYLLLANMQGIVGVVDWSAYNNHRVLPYLARRDQWGPTLEYLLLRNRKRLPDWMVRYVPPTPVQETDWEWLNRWYYPSLKYVPVNMHKIIRNRIEKWIEPMSDTEIKLFSSGGLPSA
jgi:hypothetical protein